MKRTPLKRRTPLRARRNIPGAELARSPAKSLRKKPLRRNRVNGDTRKYSRTHRRPARRQEGIDLAYRRRVRALPCAARDLGTPCRGPIDPHHPRHLASGMGTKAPDRCAIPLCRWHHVYELHAVSGAFKGWRRARLVAWQDQQVAATQERLGVAA